VSSVAAPADKRFRRAQVKPARRRRWRSFVTPIAKYAGFIAIIVFAFYRGSVVVAQARVLQVEHVAVRGNVRLSVGDVQALLQGLRGQNILWTDLGDWRERLLSSPWVKDAAFRRVLPSTIEVVLQERQPVALARIQEGLYLVDDHGVIIDEYGPAYAGFDLPIVDGLRGSTGDGASPVPDAARAELAGRVIASVHADPEIAGRVSQIDVSDVRNAAVILSGDAATIYIGDDRFLPRLQSYLQLAGTLKERAGGVDIDYVDLRFEHRIIVGPAKKGRSTK
jgi:cell division septal protein FtsQ